LITFSFAAWGIHGSFRKETVMEKHFREQLYIAPPLRLHFVASTQKEFVIIDCRVEIEE
jgi:hypothetical protein